LSPIVLIPEAFQAWFFQETMMAKKPTAVLDEVESQPTFIDVPYVPLNDFVLVRRLEDGETVVGGIVLPESAKTKSNKGEVLAFGPGRIVGDTIIPIGVERGDVVLFTRYGGTDTEIDGEKLLILRGAEIYLKLRR
jgi:chaperonin GroES